jgi:hypothetical protein
MCRVIVLLLLYRFSKIAFYNQLKTKITYAPHQLSGQGNPASELQESNFISSSLVRDKPSWPDPLAFSC